MDKPTEVFVFDDIHPEDNAMLQALYSRSPESVVKHLEKVKATGSGKFMASYYVGYGHASIGDCGSTTIFIENVSMLVAKAIQDTPLYSGQEASTRYLDFSQQPLIDPYNNPASRAILDRWMDLYNEYMPVMIDALKTRYPYNPTEYKKESAWEKSVQVRAFDTLRSLLPVGTTTLLSWHTNLRQARDHLRHLYSHPLAEVRDVAKNIFAQLLQKYPHSFNGEELSDDSQRYSDRNQYAQTVSTESHYLQVPKAMARLTGVQQQAMRQGEVMLYDALFDTRICNLAEEKLFSSRPRGAPLPRYINDYGVYKFSFLLDFGSYRDLQRHRNGQCQIPVVGNQFGFHEWYRAEMEALLPPATYTKLWGAIQQQLQAIADLPKQGVETNEISDQYLYPMGMACLTQLTYTLPQTVYVAELRSAKTVHPSLRIVAQVMGREIQQRHPALKLFIDYDADSWTSKRGEQDIVEKAKAS